MSGYLQYSNYGEDEPPMKRKVTPSADATKPNQSTQPTQPTQPNQPKRILRTNQRTLRSKPQPQLPQTQTQTQQTPTPTPHAYVQELIQNIHSYENGGGDSEDDDADNNYVPPAPSNNTIHQQFQTESVPNRNRFAGANSTDLNAKWNPAPAKEAFSLQEAKALASQYMPSVFQPSTAAPENRDVLLQKLDHIISLLEDQHDEKTGHVTEELVLYCFLGVFIIFIVDSFARAGKYVR
jgi:hypothetical protein